jgi:hypothetical protein
MRAGDNFGTHRGDLAAARGEVAVYMLDDSSGIQEIDGCLRAFMLRKKSSMSSVECNGDVTGICTRSYSFEVMASISRVLKLLSLCFSTLTSLSTRFS